LDYTLVRRETHRAVNWAMCVRFDTLLPPLYWRLRGSIGILDALTAGVTRWRSWLRNCATSQKVAGSIPDVVTEIFHWHNPSDRTRARGSTQPTTEMSTRNIFWGGGGVMAGALG